jgi:DNA-binding response OmpR family regulator
MRLAVINKRKESTKGVESYLDELEGIHGYTTYSLIKIPLENIPFNSYDGVIFDVTDDLGEDNDIHIIVSMRKIAGVKPIFLATNAQEHSFYREKMFDAGIDGAIQLPFSPQELYLRVSKLVKKKNLLFSGTTISARGVDVDLRNHTVKKMGENVSLTKTEYGILFHLFVHRNTIVSQGELSPYLQDGSSALNVHILNIRRKLGKEECIRTIPNYGFIVQ